MAIRSTQEENNSQFNQWGQRIMQLLLEQDQLTNSQIVEELDIRPSSVSQ